MKQRRALLSACAIAFLACASRVQAPSSLQVDVMHDVVVVTKEDCPKYAGWIAQTVNAKIAEEQVLLDERMRYEVALLECNARAAKASIREQKAVQALDNQSFLTKWGIPIGALGGALVTSAIWLIMTGLVK